MPCARPVRATWSGTPPQARQSIIKPLGRERGAGHREHVVAERVRAREVDGAVHLEHDPGADVGREQVDADEIATDRGRGCDRESEQASGGGTIGSRRAPSADVRPPFAGAARSAGPRRPRRPRGDDEPQVVAARRRRASGRRAPVASYQGELLRAPRSARSIASVSSQRTTSRPHDAEPRLEDDRRLELGQRQPGGDVLCPRMRDARRERAPSRSRACRAQRRGHGCR